jgi:hypothetical protein
LPPDPGTIWPHRTTEPTRPPEIPKAVAPDAADPATVAHAPEEQHD